VRRVVYRVTHKGELQSIAPTGKEVTKTIILITRLASGKFAEDWESSDDLGMLQQHGVIPPSEYDKMNILRPSLSIVPITTLFNIPIRDINETSIEYQC